MTKPIQHKQIKHSMKKKYKKTSIRKYIIADLLNPNKVNILNEANQSIPSQQK